MRGMGTLFAGLVVLLAVTALTVYMVHAYLVAQQSLREQQLLYEKVHYIAEHANITGSTISLPEPADLIVVDPNGVPHVAENVKQLRLPWQGSGIRIYVVAKTRLRIATTDPVARAAALVAAAPLQPHAGSDTGSLVNVTLFFNDLVYTQSAPMKGLSASKLPPPLKSLGNKCVMWYYNGTSWYFVVAIPKRCNALVENDYRLVKGYVCTKTGCTLLSPLKVFRDKHGPHAWLWLYHGYGFVAYAYKAEWASLGTWNIGATVAWNETSTVSLALNTRLIGYYHNNFIKTYTIGVRVNGIALLLPNFTLLRGESKHRVSPSLLESRLGKLVMKKNVFVLDMVCEKGLSCVEPYQAILVTRSPVPYPGGLELPKWIPYDFIDKSKPHFRDTATWSPVSVTLCMLVFQ